MKRNSLTILLAVACLAAIAAAVQDVRLDKSVRQLQVTSTAVDREIASLSVTLSDLRGAQMAYLATGQEPDFWLRRSSELASQMEAGLDRLRGLVTAPAAATHVETAATAVADLMSADKRARTALQAQQRYVAADVVFVDAVAPSQLIASELGLVRTAVAETTASALSWQTTVRLALLPASLIAVLLSAFGAGRASKKPEAAPPTIADMLRDLPPPVKSGSAITKAPTPVLPANPPVNLADAAELCVDLARVMDARDMQTLLERTAKVLGASGLILWVVNQEGSNLLPVLTHGYSERVLAKLVALETQADNVTSLAYRTVRPQTMLGSGPGTASAVAVPLITAGGCNGVLAAEVYDARPSTEFVSLSRVIAAQFATMINPCETQADVRAAEA